MMEYRGEGLVSFSGQSHVASAAWDLVLQANPVDILSSKPITDLVELPDIPSNPLLVKGVVTRPGGNVPLVDARMPLSLSCDDVESSAHALTVGIEGVGVGLIVGDVMGA